MPLRELLNGTNKSDNFLTGGGGARREKNSMGVNTPG